LREAQRTTRRRGGRRAILALALAVAGFVFHGLAAGPAWASGTVIVRNSDLGPYKVVAAAVEAGIGAGTEQVVLAPDQRSDETVRAIWQIRPDAIVALGARALEISSTEFPNIPVVFGMVADTYRYADKAEVAGVALIPSESQVLQGIRKVLPGANEVAVVFDPERSSKEIDRLVRAGERMGIRVDPIEFSPGSDPERVLGALARSVDCLIVYPDPVLLSNKVFVDIVYKAFTLGLPAVGYSSAFARKGALMSVEADYPSVGRDISAIVKQILGGRSPAEIGIWRPSQVKITVNTAVADELGIKVPSADPGSIEFIAAKPESL
jgi:putative ABC transport system substrate-binding protein